MKAIEKELGELQEATHMAVLGETLIFSWRGNSCHSVGLRVLRDLPEKVWALI
jgi:hypothetical protein